MYSTILAMFSGVAPLVMAMSVAGMAVLLIGGWAAKNEFAGARGLDKITTLSNVCFAAPLAVFGAEHLFGATAMLALVPKYMPWPMFWVYFVGFALIAASLSIGSKIGVRWSGLLFGIMMFLFVAMIHLPGALQSHYNRIIWTIVFRESSFGGGGWILSGIAMEGLRSQPKRTLITVGRITIGVAAVVFGIEHFLHPLVLPGVPLAKEMPTWVPGRMLIDYVTGAALLVAGGSILLHWKTRTVTTCVGGWILLLVLVIYGPVLVLALADPNTAVKVEGLNYFFDTLLFTGAILSLASASPAAANKRLD